MNKSKERAYEVYTFIWQGIEIELCYWPLKWGVISHLEIRSILPEGAQLPITETGFKSQFFQPDSIELIDGSIVEKVVQWLDDMAQSKQWIEYVENSRQGELFL